MTLGRAARVLLWAVLAGPGTAAAQDGGASASTLDAATALRDSQAAIGRSVAGHALLDIQGRPVRLADYRGKPLLVSFIYTGCFQVCPTTTRSLAVAVEQLAEVFGGDKFNVVTFSIDARESQLLAKPKREFYLKEYDGRDANRPGWWFLTATPGQFNDVAASKKTIRELTNALGYPFQFVDAKRQYDPDTAKKVIENAWGEMVPYETANTDLVKRMMSRKETDIEHPSAIAVLTPDGRVSQYLFGVDYPTGMLKDARSCAFNFSISVVASS